MAAFVVVGGGLAGIAAAVRLVQLGIKPTLIEQRSLLGGRAYSYCKPDAPELDNGHHVTLGCYDNFRALLTAIGTLDHITLRPRLRVPYRGQDQGKSINTTLRAAKLPSPLHLALALLRLPGVSWRHKLNLRTLVASCCTLMRPISR
jgi:uncharacterized protein with NAD-binding domain and iron-sulfur cluster